MDLKLSILHQAYSIEKHKGTWTSTLHVRNTASFIISDLNLKLVTNGPGS